MKLVGRNEDRFSLTSNGDLDDIVQLGLITGYTIDDDVNSATNRVHSMTVDIVDGIARIM